MKKQNRFHIAVFLGFCALLFFSCGINGKVDGIIFTNFEEFAAENEFLEQLFLQPDFQDTLGLCLIRENEVEEQKGKKKKRTASPALIIEFESSWTQTEGILVSRTWFVPREDPLKERTGTSFSACLDGSETLVPVGEIAPPYVGLLVDDLCAADENYPLIKYVSINIREEGDNAGKKERLTKKIAALETVLAQAPKPLVRNAPSIVWICAAGDLMLGRGSGDILINEGAVGVFGKTADYFKRSDLNMVNLEGAISSRGAKVDKGFNFRFDPRVVPQLKAAGIHAALLANNHAFDFGDVAFLDTLEHLEKNGIAAVGAGPDIAAAAAPFVFEADQIEIRVFGIASFPIERSGWDGASVSAAEDKAGMLFAGRGNVERLKKNFVREDEVLNVLLFHGGNEWTWKPDARTRSLYTELAQSGADLLIGSHPHTVQGFEWLDGKPVFWSLGNYVFAGMDEMDGGEEGLLIRLGYSGKTLIYFEPVPVQLKGARSDIGPANQLTRFYELSRELSKNNAQKMYNIE
ncbi:MAG: CapA family protein [Treponema sp.]|jgi:poly-gamma-glutamate synthesis protein (capsule biosynthesis protein)|nr:CapA family protein [Treponema sp.]